MDLDATDLNDFDFFGAATAAVLGIGGGTKTPAAGGVAPLFTSYTRCISCTRRTGGVSCILLKGPPPSCFRTILFRANSARKTIAAIPMIPSAMPIPAAAPLLRPPLPPSSSFFPPSSELEDVAVALADPDVEAVAGVVEDATDVLVAIVEALELVEVGLELAEEEAELSSPFSSVSVSKRLLEVYTRAPVRTSGCVSQPMLPT